MRFRSEITLPPSSWQIDHASELLLMGSCFADRIGARLQQYKFTALVNPFGILYHPLALLQPLQAAWTGTNPFQGQLFQQDGQWRSFQLHSRLQAPDKPALQAQIQAALDRTAAALRQAQVLVLTFGTAIAFRHLPSDRLVANCHKAPASEFSREMLPLPRLHAETSSFLHSLLATRPDLKVLLTVSPIRHLRSGIVENSASKAILRTLCTQLTDEFAQVAYFPAYELMLDDLRDYRFYQADLAHPTEMAEDYIWEKFRDCYVAPSARNSMAALDQIRRDLAHRPRDPHSPAHKSFLLALQDKIAQQNARFDLSREAEKVAAELRAISEAD